MLQTEEYKALSVVRMEYSEQCCASANALFATGDYKGAANRAYYAVFHAMRAVLALDGIDMKRHSGIISEFRRLYIKTGKFDVEYSRIIQNQSDARSSSDYDDFFVISKSEVAEQLDGAKKFVGAVKAFLNEEI